MHYLLGIKSFEQVPYNQSVIAMINKTKIKNKAFLLVTRDFPTFFTNIRCSELKSLMRELNIFCFRGSGKQFYYYNKNLGDMELS